MFTLGSLLSRGVEALISENPEEQLSLLGDELRTAVHRGMVDEREARERMEAGEVAASGETVPDDD